MTNAPDHRASLHLVEGEAYRRIMSGMAPETLTEFAEQLLDWLREAYPGAAPVTENSIENEIRETWHCRHDMIRGG